MENTRRVSSTFISDVHNTVHGTIPKVTDIFDADLETWNKFEILLQEYKNSGISYDCGKTDYQAVRKFSMVYTAFGPTGATLDLNNYIQLSPGYGTAFGQKYNPKTLVSSTYSLLYTALEYTYGGGVLAPNGDIHFVPRRAPVGQKISTTGVVSTYSLINSNGGVPFTASQYIGGVLSSNGDIHFFPACAVVGLKINTETGVVSTYSLINSNGGVPFTASQYYGGVLGPDGEIHFTPYRAGVGQKVNSNTGIVSTYDLVYTTTGGTANIGGIIDLEGRIIFGANTTVTSKFSKQGIMYTMPGPNSGGTAPPAVLPNGTVLNFTYSTSSKEGLIYNDESYASFKNGSNTYFNSLACVMVTPISVIGIGMDCKTSYIFTFNTGMSWSRAVCLSHLYNGTAIT